MSERLKLLSSDTVERLFTDVEKNIDRYYAGDFADLSMENGWAIETTIACWDPSIARKLDPSGTPEAEIKNSLLIYRGLEGMTPALAREERLWARFCHVECIEYTRKRWLDRADKLQQVRRRFFAQGLTGCRDDNAVGRLWWNGHIASLACPEDAELALRRLLARANIRLNVIDRADTAFRQPLVRSVVRLLADRWFANNDEAVEHFMFEVNKRSGSIVFEALSDEAIDLHLKRCLDIAKVRAEKTSG
jgi:hypothetical protein